MPHSGNLRAIAAMLAACAMFSCMDALLKALAGTYPPFQVTALRGLSAMPLVCLYVLWRREMAWSSAATCAGGCTCCAA